MTRQEMRAYTRFMCDPANSHNCAECPENEHRGNDTLPCGQQNCWVDCHCRKEGEE